MSLQRISKHIDTTTTKMYQTIIRIEEAESRLEAGILDLEDVDLERFERYEDQVPGIAQSIGEASTKLESARASMEELVDKMHEYIEMATDAKDALNTIIGQVENVKAERAAIKRYRRRY